MYSFLKLKSAKSYDHINQEIVDNVEEVIVGTNEELLLGYSIIPNEDGSLSFQPSFTNHSHTGRVKQVAVSGRFLVSGSTDEYIRIFNLNSRKEVGDILPHNGTITCLQFHESGFLFSGSDDGKINIFKRGKWQLERELKGHTEGVTGLAIHPSGKLGLSIGKDKKMITWDLMKGKRAYVVGLKKAGECILWSPDGSHYLIAAMNILSIYSVENGNIVQSIDFKEKIYCFCFVTDELLVIGGEKKNLCLYNMNLQKEIVQWEAHENRTKSLILMESENKDCKRIVSSSSDGFLKVWAIDLSRVESTPKLLGEVNTKCRVICMTLYSKSKQCEDNEIEHELSSILQKKKTRKERSLRYKGESQTEKVNDSKSQVTYSDHLKSSENVSQNSQIKNLSDKTEPQIPKQSNVKSKKRKFSKLNSGDKTSAKRHSPFSKNEDNLRTTVKKIKLKKNNNKLRKVEMNNDNLRKVEKVRFKKKKTQ